MPIAYLDESGFAMDSPRTHGYSLRGSRCYGTHNWHARGRVNAIGAWIDDYWVDVSLFSGTINSDVFFAWVKQGLLPGLRQPTVIVMDNAAFHKRADIEESIIQAGHILLFLPPYSPDLNPIEQKWAQAKSIRKKYRCKVETIFRKYMV